MDTERVVFIQMRFQEGDRERGGEGAQTAADGRSVAINFDFDELSVFINRRIRAKLEQVVQDLVTSHLNVVNYKFVKKKLSQFDEIWIIWATKRF